MGTTSSKYILEDFSPVRNESTQHKLTEWDKNPPKNLEYYSGQRFFSISRKHYPQYTQGWLYPLLGYTIDPNYYKNILYSSEESEE